jgi:predicted alpha-1,2-mannosidase
MVYNFSFCEYESEGERMTQKFKQFFMIIALIVMVIGFWNCIGKNKIDYTGFVDPFIGTGGHGHTYPGATLPFGMVQLSPDTRLTGWDGCSGYHYSDTTIYGFSHTHLSGTGVSDYGDILLMPYTGKIQLERGEAGKPGSGYSSSFSHDHETASSGFYNVKLDDNNIEVELTTTLRVGVHRYTFPSSERANIIIDLYHRDRVLDSGIFFVSDSEIEGFRRSNAWAKDQHIYFVARFSKPFLAYGISSNGALLEDQKKATGKDIKGFVSYETNQGDRIVIKVGISAVSIEGARKNLNAEAQNLSFDQIKNNAQQTWNQALGKIKTEGGTAEQTRTFYTSLYHALLNPNLFMDVDGQYRGRDLRIHQAKDFTNYTVFSLWDTYRTTHPLFTIIEPKRTLDFINTFKVQYEQGGMLPVWELAANETGCMIGYHSIPVIVDAYMKGIQNFDKKTLYEAMKHSAEQNHLGLEHYKKHGYIPAEKEAESVSKTLEYAYDDWCIAQMARLLGKQDDYKYFTQRAQSYKNLYDPSTQFIRAKLKGTWFSPFDPAEVNFNYTEANAWQYHFYVPQDIEGMINLMGGKENFINKLDQLFSSDSKTTGRKQAEITGLIGQYAHGNEPSHHISYLYNFVNQPWKTQQKVRQIMDILYSDQPDGLCGNEDCGQMSAWYVMSALGFYPVTPGQDLYVIGTPIFPKAVIKLENGHTFTVEAKHVSKRNFYIQSAQLNGKPWTRSWLRHRDIIKNGSLVLHMGPSPNPSWGSSDQDIPSTGISDFLIVPVPFASGPITFKKHTQVSLGSITPGANIYYTSDNRTPTKHSNLYKGSITLTKSTTIKAIAIKNNKQSLIMEARFDKILSGRSISLNSSYSSQYSAGGDAALIDGLKGGNDFKTGTWQGYHGVDINAVVDLGNMTTINKISTGFLQNNNSWIFFPEKVEYQISRDGKSYTSVALIANQIPGEQEGAIIQYFSKTTSPVKARYIKIHAKNRGLCPPWHKGAGEKAWVFADEIIIK